MGQTRSHYIYLYITYIHFLHKYILILYINLYLLIYKLNNIFLLNDIRKLTFQNMWDTVETLQKIYCIKCIL